MAKLRIKGPQYGANLGTVTATIGALTDSAPITAYRMPSPQTILPTISDAFNTGVLTPDDKGITPTTRIWRIVGGTTQGNGETLSGSGVVDQWIEHSPDNGVTWSPATLVGHLMGSHGADEAAALNIVPHREATHIAVGNGDWTNPSTWLSGRVPRAGAFALIPHGVSVKYDNTEPNIRLDRVRVDGTLWVDVANLTAEHITMLVETIVVTNGATLTVGTGPNDRVPATASVEFIISGKDYSAASFLPTDIKASRFQETRGWERGFIVMGVRRFWGNKKLTWAKADPIDQSATSLTLHKAPTGWVVGDTIVIGGTNISITGSGTTNSDPMRYVTQDEERVISNIEGNVISWGEPLRYPHKNQLAGSTRTDLYPNIMMKRGKNITVRSEMTSPVWRRGHDVQMHHHTVVDLWDAQFIDLGRTDKEFNSGIIKTSAPDKLWGIPDEPGYGIAAFENRPLTNRSNLQSRYSIHLHHVGFGHTGVRPIVSDCYVEGSPGWAVVHHSCDADFHGLAIYKFYGAGLVSEQGDELGAWVDCLAMGATTTAKPRAFDNKPRRFNTNPKIADNYGAVGDGGRHGYGFYFRGRAMRTNRCVANSCGWGHVFFNRGDRTAANIVPMAALERKYLDIRSPKMAKGEVRPEYQIFDVIDYPIIHHSDNESVGCWGGLFVTKGNQRQAHDVNIKIKRMKSWGHVFGAMVEYIGTYILDQFDMVAGPDGAVGIIVDANTYQVAVVNPRIEGGTNGLKIGGGGQNFNMNQDDPRWIVFGLETVDIAEQEFFYGTSAASGSTNETATVTIADLDGSFIDYHADPVETYPLVLLDTDSKGVPVTDEYGNATGLKSDNLSAAAELVPKKWDEDTLHPGSAYWARNLGDIFGRWQYNGKDAVVYTEIVSDRLTARPKKVTKMVTAPLGTYLAVGTVDNGPYTYVSTPVSVQDVTAVVAKNGSVPIDIIAGSSPSGGNGSFVLDAEDTIIVGKEYNDTIKADNGIMILDGSAGTVTYTPDRDYVGTDEFYVFVRSGSQYGTVRLNVLINDAGSDAGLTTPVVDTHFSAADGGSQTINVNLLAPPDVSGRRIERTFYSTDKGLTWRRLCHGWKQAVHKITAKSDGAPLTAGSHNLRIRYKTDYDYRVSTASSDTAVTVA